MILTGSLVRNIGFLLYPIHILESSTRLRALPLAWKIKNTVLSSIIFKVLESYFTFDLWCTLHTPGDRPKEAFYSVVNLQMGNLSNKEKEKKNNPFLFLQRRINMAFTPICCSSISSQRELSVDMTSLLLLPKSILTTFWR